MPAPNRCRRGGKVSEGGWVSGGRGNKGMKVGEERRLTRYEAMPQINLAVLVIFHVFPFEVGAAASVYDELC